MYTQFNSKPLRTSSVLFILGALVLAACCPPNCPPSPTMIQSWDDALSQGDYGQITEQTSSIIESGEDAEFYAEARLYRGLAELYQDGDLEAARVDLNEAEKRIDQLATVDPIKEQVLLFRGQMVVHARLGEIEVAERYLNQAIELAPEQSDAIVEEFERAIRQP